MSDRLAAALRVAAMGIGKVYPAWEKFDYTDDAKYAGGDVYAPHRTRKHASTNPDVLRQWWGEIANCNPKVLIGAGVLVIDIDTLKGGHADGLGSVKKLGGLDKTYCERTASGGRHVVYWLPEGVRFKNTLVADDLPGIEFLGEGATFIASGSVTGKGIYTDNGLTIAPAPAHIVALIERLKPPPVPTRSAYVPAPNTGSVSDALRRWALRELDDAIAELKAEPQGNRNRKARDVGYWVGRIIHLLGMSTEAAVEALEVGVQGWKEADRKGDVKSLRRGIERGSEDEFTPAYKAPIARSPTLDPQTPDPEPKDVEPPAVERPKAVAWSPSVESQASSAKHQAPSTKPKPAGQRYLIACTADDVGNAECVVRRHEGKFLYCNVYGWLAWNGRYWQRDGAEAKLNEAVIETLKARRLMAVENDREAIVTAARGSAKHVRDCVYLLRGMLEEQISAFDADLDSVNVDNGVLCLRTGKVTAHDHSQRFTYCLTAGYDPNVSFAKWHEFIVEAVQGGHEVAQWLQLYFGYCLTGRTRYEVLLYLYGKARAGKGTVMQVLRTVMGKLAKEVDFATFIGSRDGDSNNFDLAGLRECRLVSAEETDEYERLNAAKIKQLTGGNDVRCSYKHKDMFEYKPMWKMTLVSNHPINADPDDSALWSRLRVVNFPNSMVGKEDVLLKEKLTTREGQAAVLAWLVAGARRFYELSEAGQAMPYPAVLAAVTNHQRQVLDNVGQWLMECCVSVETAFCSSKALHSSYEKWCRENGVTPKQQRGLTLALQNKGFESDQRKVDGTPVRGVVGLGLKVV